MSGSIKIPTDPAGFFERFFPEQFTQHRDRYPRQDSPGSALFRVVGVGSWGVKIAAGELVVTRGRPADTLLQITVSRADFRAIFVERTQREIDATGDLSDDSRDAFKPLFVDDRKVLAIATAIGDVRSTLVFDLDDLGKKRHLSITPGALERTEPRATISMKVDDFLAMQSGRKHPALLFLLRRLKIHGDRIYAVRMSALLS